MGHIGTGDSEHALVDGVGAESAISASVMDLFNLASDNLAVFGDAVLDVELPGPAHLRADHLFFTSPPPLAGLLGHHSQKAHEVVGNRVITAAEATAHGTADHIQLI